MGFESGERMSTGIDLAKIEVPPEPFTVERPKPRETAGEQLRQMGPDEFEIRRQLFFRP
jgi:hypothetical protein